VLDSLLQEIRFIMPMLMIFHIYFSLCIARAAFIESNPSNNISQTSRNKILSSNVTYSNLSRSSEGRHLLLISLLENIKFPYWVPRCHGYLRLYLPPILASVNQPPLIDTAQVLPNITDMLGNLLTRKEVVAMLNNIEDFHLGPDTYFSRFNKTHIEVVKKIATLCSNQKSFDNMFSMLVVFKEFIPEEMFMDIIYQVVQVRADIGFILPTVISVLPDDFFPGALLDKISNSSTNRERRQAFTWGGRMLEVYWHHGEYRTMPDWEPEGRLWYFNEDPLINANHFHWHQVLSSEAIQGSWIHSSNLHRRGEMFYFMHRQFLARFNNERLSVGLNLTDPFGPHRWDKPIFPGYDPKLGRGSSRRFAPRPPGVTLYPWWVTELHSDLAKVRDAIKEGVIHIGPREVKLEYKDGVDRGISDLGDVVESYVESRYGNFHNLGHTVLANSHKGVGEGVLNSPNVAIRDPLFGQWHQFVDTEFQKYKRGLGFYQDEDLNFPGVTVTNMTLQSATPGTPDNILTTYMDHGAYIQLNSLDLMQTRGSSVLIRYSRLNTVQFAYNISVTTSHSVKVKGMARIFLIPDSKYLPPDSDITQIAIEIDRFHVHLNEGDNTIIRQSIHSSFVAKHRDTLFELQNRLLWGELTQDQFNWGGCGWPKEMLLPRGSESGFDYKVFLVLSPLLKEDPAHSADWGRLEQHSWAWCGVRADRGGMPDSRPMGFPLDRPPPDGDWTNLLLTVNNSVRSNMIVTPVTITHLPDPWGQLG